MKCTPNVRQNYLTFGGAFFMTKYSDAFRVAAVRKILDGNSINRISKELFISKALLGRWINHYYEGGTEQLLHKNRKYSPEFKKDVIEYKWEHGLSLIQTIAHFKIPNDSTVIQWERKYLEEGFSGLLPKKKGRPGKMPKKKEIKPPNLTREQELEAEIAQLKMENAYLKKLNALVQARKKQEQMKK